MGVLYCLLQPKGHVAVRLVQVEAGLQGRLEDHFGLYEQQFYEGVDEVIGFDGGYRPDDNQLIHLPQTEEMSSVCRQIEAGAIGREIYDPRVDVPDDIRALLWHYQGGDVNRILVQNFTRAQSISRRGLMVRWTDQATFNSFDEPAFLIENKIHGVLALGRLEFKKFNILKQIFDLSAVYREATDQDVHEFLRVGSLQVADEVAFVAALNATQRKLIFSVQRSEVLDRHTSEQIIVKAATVGIPIVAEGGRIALPSGRDLTTILKFLDNSVYTSPVDDQRYMANSRRRMV